MNFSSGTRKEKEYFIENLIMLTGSGLDIVSSLDIILADIKTPSLRKTLTTLKDTIARGEPIHSALEQTHLFKPHVVSLIRLGEQSGKLFQNLQVISIQQKKERAFQSKMRSALMYPVFILSIAGLVGIAVAWFILPNLASVFSQMKLTLPLITKVLIAVGLFLKFYGIIAVPLGLGFIAFLIYMLFFFPKTKFIGQCIMLSFPGIGSLIRQIELARMGYITGTLLQAGVPIVDTLQSLRETAAFFTYQRFYLYLKESIEKGYSLKDCFEHYKNGKDFIPTPVQQMIVAGERSGRLPDIFLRVGELFEAKTDNSTKDLSVILEPLLLLVVWVSVVGIALAVILPIYSLIGGLNQ